MAKLLVIGFSESRGVSAKNGSAYCIVRLFPLVPSRQWKTDNGQCSGAGFCTDENRAFSVLDDAQLIAQLKAVQYPCYMELTKSDDPTDPTKTVVSGFKVVGEPIKTMLN